MNKTFLIIICFLIALAALGKFLLTDAGYLLLQWHGIAVETSVIVFAAFALFIGLCLVIIFRTLTRILGIASQLSAWQNQRSRRKVGLKINQGILSLLQEDWVKASAALSTAGSHKDFDIIRLLGLANAAQGEGNFETRDQFLHQLERRAGDKNALSVGLAHAEMNMEAQQWELAITALKKLHKKYPKNTVVLKRLIESAIQHGDWKTVTDTLPQARRLNAITEQEYSQYETLAYAEKFMNHIRLAEKERQTLEGISPTSDATANTDVPHPTDSSLAKIEMHLLQKLSRLWKNAPYRIQQSHTFVLQHLDALEAAQFPEVAQHFLERVINTTDDLEYLQRYAELKSKNSAAMIEFLQKNFSVKHKKRSTHHAEYQYAMGCLYARVGDWTQARPWLEKCIQNKASPKAYHALGEVYHHMHQHEKSSLMYRKALNA